MVCEHNLVKDLSDFRVLTPSLFTLNVPPTWRHGSVLRSATSSHVMYNNLKKIADLPYDDDDKIENVPGAAQIGAGVKKKPVGDDLQYCFAGEDHQKHIL